MPNYLLKTYRSHNTNNRGIWGEPAFHNGLIIKRHKFRVLVALMIKIFQVKQ